jgi:hypothetical protein
MVDLKTKKRNRLQLENDLIICVSKIEPRFEIFFKNKQAQPSHCKYCIFIVMQDRQPLLFTFILLATATPQAKLRDPPGGRAPQVEKHCYREIRLLSDIIAWVFEKFPIILCW